MSDATFLAAMLEVENSWLSVLVEARVAPAAADTDLTTLVPVEDAEAVAAGAEADGSPVAGLVALLRERAGDQAGRWLHRGLTSQDVIDTALMLCLRDALARIHAELSAQVRTLVGLAETHHRRPTLARTLTQPALPSTLGAKMANWLSGVLDAADTLTAVSQLPVQVGGAAGTLAATTELAGSPDAALGCAKRSPRGWDSRRLRPGTPPRSVITRAGDALVECCDSWGHIANDVATGSRHEIGELTEGQGGGSSTMPHKSNPVLSVLIRRAAMTAPPLGATLHAASAASVDERSNGAWQAEWATLRTLARRTVVAAAQTSALLTGLQVNTERAAANLAAAGDVLAEQRTMAELAGRPAQSSYTGMADHLVDSVLQRARDHLKEASA